MVPAQLRVDRVGGRAMPVLVAAACALAGALILAFDSASGAECTAASGPAPVVADTWLDENSPGAAKGSDSVLSVDAGSLNVDTFEVSGRARVMLRFAMPAAIPAGCVVESARLFVFSSEETAGTRVEAVRLAGTWTESGATWSNQPATIGPGTAIWSREGYMRWNVTSQVEAMLSGANHGFLLRDAKEGAEEGGGGHGFYSREKGDSATLPYLEIRFAAPSADEPPGPAQPPVPAAVSCGQVLTQSTLVTNDLSGCLGDGLIIDAPNLIVDLGGHTIDGTGLGAGILNDGHASVTVRNGTLQEFDYGVRLFPETADNAITGLTLRTNQVAAVELFDVSGTHVIGNILDGNGGGIALVSGTRDNLVTDNTITANGKAGIFLADATGNRLERNSVGGGGDLGIGLERSSDNVLIANTSANNSDGGIEIRLGSHGNHVEGNVVTQSGDHGILVDMSDRTVLIGNVTHFMSDSGITLNDANDGVVRDNDVRFNTGGIQMDASSRNVVEANDASETLGIGIELGGSSLENVVDRNIVNANGAQGIYVADDATDPLGVPIQGLGNLIVGNSAIGNLSDGIVTAKGGHTLTANVTRDNHGWGILAALVGTIDGGGNVATGNDKPEQCQGVECREEWNAPETTISVKPPDATGSSSATFNFSGTDDTTPAAALRFACSLDGAAYASCTSPRSLAGLAHGTHTFAVRATDRAGNTDPSPATHVWVVDAVPPETTLGERPRDPSTSAVATFTFSGSDDGAGGSAVSFQCRIDAETEWSACTSPTSSPGLVDGSHTFAVVATDAAGNTDASPASYTWTIDTTAPDTLLDERPADPTRSTDARFTFASTESGSIACALDGADLAPCTSPAGYAGLAEGSHTFLVVATDAAGNSDPSPATHTWAIDLTPPETAIDDGPRDPTNATTATFEVSANEAAAFVCMLDAAEPTPCDASVSYDGLTEGPHTFAVVATDAAGNTDEGAATYSWTLDTTAPDTTIQAGPADPTNGSSATFRFDASESSTFECALDEATYAACDSPASYPGLEAGTHAFRVRATDRAGNTDGSAATHTWTIDVTPPETTIDARPADATNSTTATFALSATEVATFACALDASEPAPCDASVSYLGLAEGSHTFEVAATDAAGNTDDSPATYTWKIDVTSPETTIDDGPRDPTNASTATFELSASEAATFACALDAVGPTPCDPSVTYDGLAEGPHTFEVVATDAAGNTDETPATHTWTVDTTAPVTTIDTAPADRTNQTSASFGLGASEAATFACALDGADAAPCDGSVAYDGLGEGTHTFAAFATDTAGNADGSPATHTWTVDTTPPETTIGEAPDDPTNSTSATFLFSATEASSFACALDAGEAAPCDASATYTGLAAGRHELAVRATDVAGNSDATAATHAWTVDLVAPQTIIDDGPPDPTNVTSATFAFRATEASTFVCALDAAQPVACDSSVSYVGLAEGSHTFRVAATDAAGNSDASPATRTWTIDTTPPQTFIDDGPVDPTDETTASFGLSASEAATFSCALDDALPAACGPSAMYEDLGEGTHTFSAVATDAAGNADETAATHAWTIEADAPPPTDTTAPDTTFGDRPDDPTNQASTTFTFSGTDDTTAPESLRFECRLDSGDPVAFATCTSPAGHTGLAPGTHTFEVRAIDAEGNVDPEPASYAWTVDTAPPDTTLGDRPSNPTNQTSATFTFAATDDLTDAGALSFECRLDTAVFAACTSPQPYVGMGAGPHRFEVRATDAAGNTDGSPASHAWTIDTTAPNTTITAGPAANSTTTSTSATFNFTATESGSSFECSLDSTTAYAACATPHTYTGLSVGSRTFRVRAIDPAGNTDISPASRTWTVQGDTTAPNTTITGGPAQNSSTTSTSATFSFTATESGSTFQCSLDSTNAYSACTSPRTYSGLGVGSHSFLVRATDPAGNTDGSPASRTWTVLGDTTPPNTTITGGPAQNSTTTSTSAEFSFTGSETGSTFQCSLDSTTAYAACTSPHTVSGLGAGPHTFRVRAIDPAGNTDGSPAARTWTVEASDGCAPVTLVAAADAWIEQNSATSNKGSDSILKVKSQGPTDNFRALVRFTLPGAPEGCVFESATLRLYAPSSTSGRTIEAQRLAGAWTENAVTWGNQPTTVGQVATTASGSGTREWEVTTQVQAMYDGVNHGFLIRDAAESGTGFEQSFHAREKGENPPTLLIRFAPVAPVSTAANAF